MSFLSMPSDSDVAAEAITVELGSLCYASHHSITLTFIKSMTSSPVKPSFRITSTL